MDILNFIGRIVAMTLFLSGLGKAFLDSWFFWNWPWYLGTIYFILIFIGAASILDVEEEEQSSHVEKLRPASTEKRKPNRMFKFLKENNHE